MFKKVLIAARGEIALRIHRACKELEIKTVAVHSTADADAMHVRMADESVCIGPASAAKSYLNKPAIITAALMTGAEAIHPGYGFLSENADFAEMVEAHGIKFIGPKPAIIRQMSNKLSARQIMQKYGIPVLPSSNGELKNLSDALNKAEKIGYPVILKAVNGGGGKGIRPVFSADEMKEAFNLSKREAKSAFSDDALYMEKYLPNASHLEFQILADNFGNVIHLGERNCSIQRNKQKIIEEATSQLLSDAERKKIGNLLVKAAKKIGYTNLGTMEFLYDDGHLYFMEMNTRLQVEHPVTEMVTGIDMVCQQLFVAAGYPLIHKQKDINFTGHAIECRINAEDDRNFIPCPGRIGLWHIPGGLWVRVDSEAYSGYDIPPNYDSLIAKLIVFGSSRKSCIMRLRRALDEFVVEGVKTNIPMHQRIINSPEFISGKYDINWLEKFIKQQDAKE